MYDSKRIVSHRIILKNSNTEIVFDKIIHYLKTNARNSFPTLRHRGKYVKFISRESYRKIEVYYYDNTGLVLFNDYCLISAIIEFDLLCNEKDVLLDVSIHTEPKPSKYTTSVSENNLEFMPNKNKIYWVDVIHQIRKYLKIEYSKEDLEALYPKDMLGDRQNRISETKKKMMKFWRDLAFAMQFAMIFPFLGTFIFVYYDRGVYEWTAIWILILIGPALYVMFYPFMVLKIRTEIQFVNQIRKKYDELVFI